MITEWNMIWIGLSGAALIVGGGFLIGLISVLRQHGTLKRADLYDSYRLAKAFAASYRKDYIEALRNLNLVRNEKRDPAYWQGEADRLERLMLAYEKIAAEAEAAYEGRQLAGQAE